MRWLSLPRLVLAAACAALLLSFSATRTAAHPPGGAQSELATVRVVAVGDLMLGRKVNIGSLDRDDFRWPFRATADVLRSADLTVGNFEGTLVNRCPPTPDRIVFCADPRAVQGLVWAGFDAVSLANNHSRDYFEVNGFDQTVRFLEEAGIAPVYGERVMVWEVSGLKVGLMGLDDTLSYLNSNQTAAAIAALDPQVDILLGIVHWGQEYTAGPTERQQRLGRLMVDAGMDAVIGAHPHWVQTVEEYNGRVIVYSLGNFVFDQMWSEQTRRGDIVRLQFTAARDGTLSVTHELIPVTTFDYGQPRIGGLTREALYAGQ
jgi:poly-gamma-glutamate synthesis protein (capsule biosynthesis protein)